MKKVSKAVWADGFTGRVTSVVPTKVLLKKGVTYPKRKQYLLRKEALKGIQPILRRFLNHRLIWPC
jgi:hypothetical protein